MHCQKDADIQEDTMQKEAAGDWKRRGLEQFRKSSLLIRWNAEGIHCLLGGHLH